ncbi:hypothetical protein E4U21_007418 [Claviceps maximensis]|nr:hypothetical protein E4U21_007418 [Claviceps maximensis]
MTRLRVKQKRWGSDNGTDYNDVDYDADGDDDDGSGDGGGGADGESHMAKPKSKSTKPKPKPKSKSKSTLQSRLVCTNAKTNIARAPSKSPARRRRRAASRAQAIVFSHERPVRVPTE